MKNTISAGKSAVLAAAVLACGICACKGKNAEPQAGEPAVSAGQGLEENLAQWEKSDPLLRSIARLEGSAAAVFPLSAEETKKAFDLDRKIMAGMRECLGQQVAWEKKLKVGYKEAPFERLSKDRYPYVFSKLRQSMLGGYYLYQEKFKPAQKEEIRKEALELSAIIDGKFSGAGK